MAEKDKLVNLEDLKAAHDNVKAMVAPDEASTTASAAHVPGTDSEFFIMGGVLYQATSDIDIGDTITPNTNCKEAPLGESVSELKGAIIQNKDWAYNNLIALDNGKILLNGTWSLGNMSTVGNLYIGDSYNKRVISLTAMKLSSQATLKIADGYIVRVGYYYTPNLKYGDGDNPNMISMINAATGSITIAANTWFDIMIAQSTDPQIADVKTFVESVYFESNIDSRITELESAIGTDGQEWKIKRRV